MTITDRREIVFDSAAIAAVLECSGQMAGTMGLPMATPKHIEFDPKEGTIGLTYGVGGHSFPLRSGPLSALLIAYCMRAKIKIPRQVARSMRVEPQAVVLVFSAIHPVPPLSLSPERPEAPPRSMSWMEPQPIQRRRPH